MKVGRARKYFSKEAQQPKKRVHKVRKYRIAELKDFEDAKAAGHDSQIQIVHKVEEDFKGQNIQMIDINANKKWAQPKGGYREEEMQN